MTPTVTLADTGTGLERALSATLAPALPPETQSFLRRVAAEHNLDSERLRWLAEAARDLEMWRETSIESRWTAAEAELRRNGSDAATLADRLMERIAAELSLLRETPQAYPRQPLTGIRRDRTRVIARPAPARVFGLCPTFSASANCCGLYTIDALSGCGLSCSYCPTKATYGETMEISEDLGQRLKSVWLDENRFYHVGTGQMSDSLVLGNRGGILDALCEFAAEHPNVLLELKTKTDRIEYLLEHDIPANVVCSWILNTDTIIRNEEPGTLSLERRLAAARAVADRGIAIGFHLHPLVAYQDWRAEYSSLAGRMMAAFSPDEVEFVSLAAMYLTPDVARFVRRRGGETRALQMPMIEEPPGKLGYSRATRLDLYRTTYQAFRPWHDRVFFLLCMETTPVWEGVFGRVESIRDCLRGKFAPHLG